MPSHNFILLTNNDKKFNGDVISITRRVIALIEELRVGVPSIVSKHDHGMRIVMDDCFCEGLPVIEGKLVCDLEGAIIEGALTKLLGRKTSVKEVKCNVNGDDRCEYEIRCHG